MQKTSSKFDPLWMSVITSLAYMAGDLLSYPIDTVITRMRALNHISAKYTYLSIVKNEGKKQLMKGATLSIMTSFVPSVVYFYIYQNMMYKVSKTIDIINSQNNKFVNSLKLLFPIFVAFIADAASLLINVPFDVIRTRIQSGDPFYAKSPIKNCIMKLIKQQGIKRPYKSSHIYIICSLTYTGIQFQLMQVLRFYLKTQHLCIIFVSTLIATIATNPLDFIMTRHVLLRQSQQSLKVRYLVKSMLKQYGWNIMMRGTIGKLAMNTISCLIWFPTYSNLKKYGWTQTQ